VVSKQQVFIGEKMKTKPKFKIGQQVIWKSQVLTIQAIRSYQDYGWIYDFFPTQGTILPFHFTAIPESELRALSSKKWWQFWKEEK